MKRPMMKHRRWGIAAVALGATLLVGAAAVRVVAAPALIRFPLGLDETTTYTGTAASYVDQVTLLPLAKPKTEPLEIKRRVKVVSGTFSKAVIDETVTVKTGATTNIEAYQYVIDRRTMKMVSDPRQVAFGDSTAVMHAAPGAFRVNFPMGTNTHDSYRAFIPEEDAYSQLVLVEGPHQHPDAHVQVIDFSSKLDGPVAPYYLEHLKKMGLPMEVTPAQLLPLLAAEGIDVNSALADVGPRLTPAESKLVTTTLAKSVPLEYFFLSDGMISIEPRTGTLIDVHTHQQGVAVQPDLSGANVLQPVLARYDSIPSVHKLSAGLAALAKKAPQVAESYRYTQTVPSSVAVTTLARDHVRTMNLIKFRVPVAMIVLGLALLVLGLVPRRRAGRGRSSTNGPVSPSAAPPVIPTEPAPAPDLPARTYEGV